MRKQALCPSGPFGGSRCNASVYEIWWTSSRSSNFGHSAELKADWIEQPQMNADLLRILSVFIRAICGPFNLTST